MRFEVLTGQRHFVLRRVYPDISLLAESRSEPETFLGDELFHLNGTDRESFEEAICEARKLKGVHSLFAAWNSTRSCVGLFGVLACPPKPASNFEKLGNLLTFESPRVLLGEWAVTRPAVPTYEERLLNLQKIYYSHRPTRWFLAGFAIQGVVIFCIAHSKAFLWVGRDSAEVFGAIGAIIFAAAGVCILKQVKDYFRLYRS